MGLHWLASGDSFWQLECIRYLVEKGPNINATNGERQIPLYIAIVGYVLAEFLPYILRVQLPNSLLCQSMHSLCAV